MGRFLSVFYFNPLIFIGRFLLSVEFNFSAVFVLSKELAISEVIGCAGVFNNVRKILPLPPIYPVKIVICKTKPNNAITAPYSCTCTRVSCRCCC